MYSSSRLLKKLTLSVNSFRALSNYIVLGTEANLQKIVNSPENKVLYFTATWCPPCKMIAPIFEKLSKEHTNVKFVKIDIDDHADAAAEYKIRSVPTFMFFQGETVKSQVMKENYIY
jgi:thioredoxin 1